MNKDYILTTLETCLTVFRNACDCGECGPCKHQPAITSAIASRQTETKLIAAIREGLPSAPPCIAAALELLECSHG